MLHNLQIESEVSELGKSNNSPYQYDTHTFEDIRDHMLENITSPSFHEISFSPDSKRDRLQEAGSVRCCNYSNKNPDHNVDNDILLNENSSNKIISEGPHSNLENKRRSTREKEFTSKNAVPNHASKMHSLRKGEIMGYEKDCVGQRITAYEKNACCRKYSRKEDQCISDGTKYRTIGIPLVGMRNICGPPVITSWRGQGSLRSLQTCGKVINCSPRKVWDIEKNRTVTKKPSKRSHISSTKIHTIGSRNSHPAENVSLKHRAATTKMRREPHSLNSCNKYLINGPQKVRKNDPAGYVDSFSKKSLTRRNSKRKTLYAKNDGEDAVQALKNLCLNPLARNKFGTDMMW